MIDQASITREGVSISADRTGHYVAATHQPYPEGAVEETNIRAAAFDAFAGFIGKVVTLHREYTAADHGPSYRARLTLTGRLRHVAYSSGRHEFSVMVAGTGLPLPGAPDADPNMPQCDWRVTLAE